MEKIRPEQLKAITLPSDGEVPTYDSATKQFKWEVISGGGSGGGGDMYKSTYDTDDDGIVDSALTVVWAENTKEPTGFANRTTSSMSFNNSTREFIIAPSGASTFPVYIKGDLYNKTSESIIITPTSGCHFIYWDLSNTLLESTTPWQIPETVQIATVYWNGSAGLLAEERHGCIMDMDTHEYLHDTVGSRYSSGLAGAFTDTTFSIGVGEWYDEDLAHANLSDYTTCRVLWLIGTVWNWSAGQTKYYHEVSNILQYNNAGALANVSDNRYVAYWIYATSNIAYPIISIMGQREDTNIANARANNKPENLVFGTLPFGEMKLLYRVIVRRSGTSEVYQEAQDYRSVSPLPTSNYIATDHGTLTGLQDQDHGASAIFTDTTGFNRGLSASETSVQLALDEIDNTGVFTDLANTFTVGPQTLLYAGAAKGLVIQFTDWPHTARLFDVLDPWGNSYFNITTAKFSVNVKSYITSLGVGADIVGNAALYAQKQITTSVSEPAMSATLAVNPTSPITTYGAGMYLAFTIGGTANVSGIVYGAYFGGTNWSANTIANMVGGYFSVAQGNTIAATGTDMTAGQFAVNIEDATYTYGYGIKVTPPNVDAGTLTYGYGVSIQAPTKGAGTYTWLAGLNIGDISVAGTNYSIFTHAGLVHFGDNVELASTKTLTISAGSIITDTTTGLKIGTATNQKIGFFNATPTVQSTGWSVSNVSSDKSFDADSTTLNELADVLGSLITELLAKGLLGA